MVYLERGGTVPEWLLLYMYHRTVPPSQMPGLPAPGVIATIDGVEIVVDENPVFGPGVFIASDRCVRLNAASKVTEFD